MKWKWHIYYSVEVLFALLTCFVIYYAFCRREQSDLVFVIFNLYALLAVILSLILVVRVDRTQQRRKQSTRKRLAHLTENLSSPALLWSDDFSQVVINEKLTGVTGIAMRDDYDARELVGLFFGMKEMNEADIRRIVMERNLERRCTAPDGTNHELVWVTSSVETDSAGVTTFLSIAADLAELRSIQSELADYSRRLAASEGRYALSMELTDIGILLIEQGNPKLFPSDKLCAMLGLQGTVITVPELEKLVYPADMAVFERHLRNMRESMRAFVGEMHRIELRVRAADGQYHWYSYRFKAKENPETGRLVVGGSVIDISEQKAQEAMIEQLAYVDDVTGMPNRNRLMRMGEELYAGTVEMGTSYWVIVMDIDRFHLINDTCGYAEGNRLLQSFAEVMNAQIKSYGGFAARISGDNFALILRDSGEDDLPDRAVQRVQQMLATKASGTLVNRNLTCSAGYARMPADGDSFEHILEHAEFAVSANKRLGSISRYTSVMHDSIIRESDLEMQLAEAIQRNELVLYYQPKVALETGELIGLEALVRWQHPSGQMISPGVFIPIAEKSHLITQITRFVMNEACRQARQWQKMGLPPIVMSVNVSGTDFYQQNICEQLLATLSRNQLDPRWLEIELTESLALKDIDLTIMQMQQIRAAGIQIAMDDFGTGYSSLSYIQRLPFTMLKMDRSFVLDMETDPVVREIVCSVMRIAKAKRIHTIVEGVEKPEQARLLRLYGCDYIQGYLYGHPMDAAETEAYMRENMTKRKVY
ncbi:MAG TPA: hypothetical protein DDX71_06475 [Ruminococcus sp.]|nr:hypothetical protein [Ruminococcus sp.]